MIQELNWASLELLTMISMRSKMPWTIRIILLQATMRGAVSHGMEVWLSAPSTLIRRAEAKMMRRIFGYARKLAAAAIWWLTKVLPMDTKAQARSLKLTAKILDMELEEGEPALELLALNELIKEFQKFRTGWYSTIVAIVRRTFKYKSMKEWASHNIGDPRSVHGQSLKDVFYRIEE